MNNEERLDWLSRQKNAVLIVTEGKWYCGAHKETEFIKAGGYKTMEEAIDNAISKEKK